MKCVLHGWDDVCPARLFPRNIKIVIKGKKKYKFSFIKQEGKVRPSSPLSSCELCGHIFEEFEAVASVLLLLHLSSVKYSISFYSE